MISDLIGFVFLFGFLMMVAILPRYIKYRSSEYKLVSEKSFANTCFDTGNYGEFLTFRYLENLDVHRRIMTNVYLPKAEGGWTEVDLLMIAETGVYVFESKNYSGWIFGDEKDKSWTQVIKGSKKYRFYNPIWQNKGHITALKSAAGLDEDEIYKSYIVFSERCVLKQMHVISANVKVLNRPVLNIALEKDIKTSKKLFTVKEVDKLYFKLYQYKCVTEEVKKAHVESVKAKKMNSQSRGERFV